MNLGSRLDRREWLARLGVATAGVGGVVLTLGGKRTLGVLSSSVEAGAKSSALRVNLGFVSAYVVVRGESAALVDTGVAGSVDAIEAVILAAGLSWDNLQHLILTHHHGDHQGSAQAVLDRARNALIWAGPADMPNIRVNRPVRPAEDGADLFGLQVLATPGHTLGHISLLDPELGALITGDAIVNVNNQLASSPPMNTVDQDAASASVRKMGARSYERVLFGHGEPIESGGAAAVRALGASLP